MWGLVEDVCQILAAPKFKLGRQKYLYFFIHSELNTN